MAALTFAEHDRLDRKRFADFLLHLVLHCDEYRRGDESQSYAIALDSPYGTGKTHFLSMFCSEYEHSQADIAIASYNAWEHDLSADAFSPFVLEILAHPLFADTREAKGKETASASFKEVVLPAIAGIAKAICKEKMGETVADIIDAVLDGAKGIDSDKKALSTIAEKYRAEEGAIADICRLMGERVALSGKKLLVIVDELDRCKPLFAIQTLEVMKHIMNIPGVVFLYALDLNQLKQSVRKVYGADFDAEGYLRRFFEYYSKMPPAAPQAYFRIISDASLFLKERIQDFFAYLLSSLDFSLRDIDTVYQQYRVMHTYLLSKYVSTNAHKLYIFLLLLKCKDRNLFDSFLKGNKQEPQLDQNIRTFQGWHITLKGTYGFSITDLCEQMPLQIEVDQSFGTVPDIEYKAHIDIEKLTIKIINDKKKCVLVDKQKHYTKAKLEDTNSLGGVLFGYDLEHFAEISGQSVGHYLHKQLEFFDFENE